MDPVFWPQKPKLNRTMYYSKLGDAEGLKVGLPQNYISIFLNHSLT